MKQIFTLTMIILFSNVTQAQDSSYTDLWKKVEQFEIDGLPKSALEVVNQIATKAEIDKNAPLQIKTLLFKSKYALTLEEDAQLNIITDFKDQIAKNTFPTKHILHCIQNA